MAYAIFIILSTFHTVPYAMPNSSPFFKALVSCDNILPTTTVECEQLRSINESNPGDLK